MTPWPLGTHFSVMDEKWTVGPMQNAEAWTYNCKRESDGTQDVFTHEWITHHQPTLMENWQQDYEKTGP